MIDLGHTTTRIIPSLPHLMDLQQAALDNLPIMISIYEIVDRTTYRVSMVNRPSYAHYAKTQDEVLGKYIHEIVQPETMPKIIRYFQTCLDSGQALTVEDSYEIDPIRTIWTVSCFTPLHTEDGQITHMFVTWEDVTERKKHELAAQEAQRAIIEEQAARLTELSTPLLSVSDTTVVMPLIGTVDEQRVQLLMESLLTGVSLRRATTVILDITGVPLVDTYVANALVRASQAVRLLGARVLLVGIRPEVAQTLVGLGVDLSSIITLGTLRDGIAYALR